jgi:hypothetical protein
MNTLNSVSKKSGAKQFELKAVTGRDGCYFIESSFRYRTKNLVVENDQSMQVPGTESFLKR